MNDPVVLVKKITDWMGANVCVDAVGAEAAGSPLQTITERKLLTIKPYSPYSVQL